MKKSIFSTILNFLIIFLAINLVMNFFFKKSDEPSTNDITLITNHTEYGLGDIVNVDIKNNTANTVTLKNECPNEPLDVLYNINGTWTPKTKVATLNCAETTDIVLKPNDKHTIDYASWNHSLFGDLGKYKLHATVLVEKTATASSSSQTAQTTMQSTQQAAATTPIITQQTIESNEFEMKPQGWLGGLWTTLFSQPIQNILIYLVSIIPGHDLGLALILLTILIRTILLIPSQNALKSQRKLQEVQPKLTQIREKYKDNQEMITKETMAIWKENKVNPFGSCLPLLIQIPVLIALYSVVKTGLNPENSYLLYGSLKNFDFSQINTVFFGILDLTKVNFIILPLIVGALQFVQMKLAIVRTKKIQLAGEDKSKKGAKNEMEMANNMMLYVMPGMIAVFTASAPAGVGIYWCASTLYGIAQQLVVNYQSEKGKSKVKVLN